MLDNCYNICGETVKCNSSDECVGRWATVLHTVFMNICTNFDEGIVPTRRLMEGDDLQWRGETSSGLYLYMSFFHLWFMFIVSSLFVVWNVHKTFYANNCFRNDTLVLEHTSTQSVYVYVL